MPEMTQSTETGSTEKVSLLYIFWVFLKLGATAFGGYMSLVAIVQKQLVEIDKKLKEEDLFLWPLSSHLFYWYFFSPGSM